MSLSNCKVGNNISSGVVILWIDICMNLYSQQRNTSTDTGNERALQKSTAGIISLHLSAYKLNAGSINFISRYFRLASNFMYKFETR